MAQVIAVMGESGAGKTTAMRTLPPEETMYIDADGKGLSWKGWRSQYNKDKRNYLRTSKNDVILSALAKIHDDKDFAHIKYVVIDTFNGCMIDDEMERMKEKGYDKWADLAAAIYGTIGFMLRMREDVTCICIFHSQTERDDLGNVWTRIKTNGRKLDKIVVESKFTSVLWAKCIDGQHVFEVHANNSTAKTPMGAFDEQTVPNDMYEVIKRLEEYR